MDIVVKINSKETEKIVQENKHYINSLAKIGKIDFTKSSQKQNHSASAIVGDVEISVLLEGKIDFELERKRLEAQLVKINHEMQTYETKISNKNFIEKADPKEVERVNGKFQEISNTKQKTEEIIKTLGGVK